MALDWTTMVNHVVIAGRPADVEDAALGWQELIGNVRDVCTSLEQDIKGIDAFWTGKAADAFGERVKSVSQELKKVSDGAAPEGGAGIVDTLRNAAQDLQAAQAAMPVPASMLGELMAARDTRITLAPGVLEVELESGFFDNAPMSFAGWLGDQFRKVLTDVEEDARQAYDTVSTQHETAADRAPVGTQPITSAIPKIDTPDLSGGGPGVGGGGMPNIAGGGGAGGFDVPKAGGSGVGNMPGLLDGSPIGKPTGPDLGGFEPGSGLAGAGGGLATTSPPGLGGLGGGGLGAGGLGAGGLGGGAGLGSGGAGIGVPGGGLGKVPGGGSLGKPITPTVAPMGGGLAGKGGGGSTRGAGGRLGGGGMAGVGGVGAGGGAAGRGTGAARGGGMAGVGGVGAGAGGAGKGGGGKGAGGRGSGFLGGPGASGSGHGDEDEYDSWLHEDENVWNEGTDVPPPPVLGN